MIRTKFKQAAPPAMCALVERIEKPSVVDIEEFMLLESVQANTLLWYHGEELIVLAHVDYYNYLRFEIDSKDESEQRERI